MQESFNLPNMYQSRANSLPGMSSRFDNVYAGGQNQNISAPWQADADSLPSWNRDQSGRSVHNLVDSYASAARTIPDQFNRQLQLGGTSGSMMRQVHFVRGAAGGSTPFNIQAFGTRGLGATSYANWYENPWYLAGGAAAIVGAVYLLTRKKGRR